MNPKYKWKLGLKKAAIASVATAVGMATAVETIGGADRIKEASIIVIMGGIVAGVRFGLNWWKVNKPVGKK